MKKVDKVNRPPHYQGSTFESIEVIECFDLGFDFCIGNTFKYLLRYHKKNGLEDLQKARWYLIRADENIKSRDKMQENIDAIKWHFGSEMNEFKLIEDFGVPHEEIRTVLLLVILSCQLANPHPLRLALMKLDNFINKAEELEHSLVTS